MKRPDHSCTEDGNGGIELPIGFRFRPTDQELILHYLKRKVFSLPLPAVNVITEFDVFQTKPWDLPGDLKERRYFFSKMRRINTTRASFGHWKPSGKDRQIVASGGGNIVIAVKKSFFFSEKKSSVPKTQWIMHQFCLVGPLIAPYLAQKLMVQMGEWVVCRVYQKKRKARSIRRPTDQMNMKTRNSYDKGLSVTTESSCSNGITEASVSDFDQEVNS